MDGGASLIIPALLAGGGYYMQSKAQQEAADEKRSILNQQLERDDQAQKKTTSLVSKEGQNFAGDKRMTDMAANEQAISGQQQSDLQAGAGGKEVGSFDTAGDAGAVSEDFIKGKADRAVTEGNRLTALAKEIAKTRAPGMLQTNEAQRRADLASTLQNLAGSNQNMARATTNDAEAVTPDSTKMGLGMLASTIGTSMLGAKLGGGGYAQQAPAPVYTAVPKPVGGIAF